MRRNNPRAWRSESSGSHFPLTPPPLSCPPCSCAPRMSPAFISSTSSSAWTPPPKPSSWPGGRAEKKPPSLPQSCPSSPYPHLPQCCRCHHHLCPRESPPQRQPHRGSPPLPSSPRRLYPGPPSPRWRSPPHLRRSSSAAAPPPTPTPCLSIGCATQSPSSSRVMKPPL